MKTWFLSPLLLLAGCASFQDHLSRAGGEDRAVRLGRDLHDVDGRVMVAAHRGCWKDTSENSVDALEACIAGGIDVVEVDLRLTRDGEIVLLHDSNLRRMTGRDAKVADLTWGEISRLRLRAGDGRGDAASTDRPVAIFRDILAANRRRILLILDLKGPMPQTADAAARILRETGNCDLAMFAWVAPPEKVREETGDLIDCAAYLPNLRPEMGPMSDVVVSYATLNPVAVAVRFPDWDYLAEGREAPRRLGARLWVNTLSEYHSAGLTDADALADPDALWGRLIANGVNMIQTDEPEALKRYLAGIEE